MAKHNQTKLDKAIAYLSEKYHAEWCAKYGEPGYSDPETGVILANWNNIPSGLADWLEKCGYSLEWSDEWMIDYPNSKAYRTSPDCYAWESSVMLTADGEWLTPDDEASAWIDECAMTDRGQGIKCLPSRITPEELESEGFAIFAGELESGFHNYQLENPEEVAKRAFAAGASRVVFRKIENSQFYIRFECYAEGVEA